MNVVSDTEKKKQETFKRLHFSLPGRNGRNFVKPLVAVI